jgi:hypothetical protein
MKRVKMALMASAVIFGVGGAYALSNAHRAFNQNYRAVYNGSGVLQNWQSITDPVGSANCSASSRYCTATFATPPSGAVTPTGHSSNGIFIN